MEPRAEQGFSLVEVMIALGVLTTGVLGAAAVMSSGMQQLSTSPSDVIATQKATQAIEAVFAARDSHKLTWAQIRNINGAGGDGGIFLDGPQPLKLSGEDGLVNTADDPDVIESIPLPGPDRVFNTLDDKNITLNGFTREISIRNVSGEGGQLRNITVIIKYQIGTTTREYRLSTYISAYS